MRTARPPSIEADLLPCFGRAPFADAVARPSVYRGVARLGALTLATEGCDWRHFGRTAAFIGFTGLVPSEDSSEGRTDRGSISRAGNCHLRTQLIESAWAYQHGPSVGVELRRRQEGMAPDIVARAWAARARRCWRFRRLAQKKNSKNVVAAAITPELCGFLWAEMTASDGPPPKPTGYGRRPQPGERQRAGLWRTEFHALHRRQGSLRAFAALRFSFALTHPGACSQGHHPAESRHTCSDPRTTEWR